MRKFIAIIFAGAIIAHLFILLDLPFLLQAIAILTLTGFLPGLLLTEALVGQSAAPPTSWERVLYAIAAGYGTLVLGMLWVSYLPGPLLAWQIYAAFDGLILLLMVIIGFQHRQHHQADNDTIEQIQPSRWLLTGLLLLLLVGGYFRFVNLGYAEFQGDEARAALRAAAIIQGYDDVLMLHKKGPTEILIPTAIYALTDHLNELTARLPFAVANLAALFAIFLLGSRLLGPIVGWSAAMLLALDGYFIGFSRIVQYQSVVILTSVLVVLILYRLWKQPIALTRYLTLASFLLTTGLLSHYEAGLAVLPAAYLFAMILWQNRSRWLAIIGSALIAGTSGIALLTTFYLPFIQHPHFSATYTYLADRRVGDSFPYNNLSDFFLRSMVYNSSYQHLMLIMLTIIALILVYRRGLGRSSQGPSQAVSIGLVIMMALTFWDPEWLMVGTTDLIVVPFLTALLLVWLMPKLSVEERLLWLWFGLIMILALFFTLKPRTHVYNFFIPWFLLAAWTLVQGWQALQKKSNLATTIGSATALLIMVLFGTYSHWYFVQHDVEILRSWQEHHPAGYWVPYDEPDNKALFGFPLSNGWKAIGALYADGTLTGDYETSEKEAWVPAWYTRGQHRCGRTAPWFFQIQNLEVWGESDQLKMEHFLRHGFAKWGEVQLNGTRRLLIYNRTGEQHDDPINSPENDLRIFDLANYEQQFDQLALPDLPLTYPAVDSEIGNPLHINFGHEIWLEGYDINYEKPLQPGDNIRLTLYWRSQRPQFTSHKVFIQSYYGDSGMIAQQDGYPVCESRETWRWDPGELITDVYDVPVSEDAPDGLYPLYAGLYLEESFERLPVLDEAGNPVDTQIQLADIRIGVE